MANQPDIVAVDKQIGSSDRSIIDKMQLMRTLRRRNKEKLEKYHGLKEEVEKMCKVKARLVPVVIGALSAVTPRLGEWFQQFPETSEECNSRNV